MSLTTQGVSEENQIPEALRAQFALHTWSKSTLVHIMHRTPHFLTFMLPEVSKLLGLLWPAIDGWHGGRGACGAVIVWLPSQDMAKRLSHANYTARFLQVGTALSAGVYSCAHLWRRSGYVALSSLPRALISFQDQGIFPKNSSTNANLRVSTYF